MTVTQASVAFGLSCAALAVAWVAYFYSANRPQRKEHHQ